MTNKLKEKEYLQEIRRMLNGMHKKWWGSPECNGHKSAEGTIEIHLCYPNWFEAKDYEKDEPVVMCSVYSYLFGPNRMHDFSSLQEAYENVKGWYKNYMENV